MNLHGIVAGAIGAVNPLTTATLQLSAGFTQSADFHRVPAYAAPVTVQAQVQALTERDILHVDALNIAGSTHKVYLNGALDGLVRLNNKGGDLVTLANGTVWLVNGVLEAFPDWVCVAITLQVP